MAERKANASWKGTLKEGEGSISLGSGAFDGKYSFGTRMGEDPGTNPEELLGASLAGCYAMALNAALEKGGTPASSVEVDANVHFGKDDAGFAIRSIDLKVSAAVEGMSEEDFKAAALKTKSECPIGKALSATTINVEASLA